MNSKNKGDIAEARALFEFQRLGISVLLPWGDNLRYDMAIDYQGKISKVQVKYCDEESYGSIHCYTRSSTNHTTNKKLSTYEKDVDYFVFYNSTYDVIALVPIEEIGNKKSISLRIRPALNGQEGRLFSDYSFEKTLCVETLHETPKL